jgi:hypothetical protein
MMLIQQLARTMTPPTSHRHLFAVLAVEERQFYSLTRLLAINLLPLKPKWKQGLNILLLLLTYMLSQYSRSNRNDQMRFQCQMLE